MEVHETQKEFKNDSFFLLKYDLEPKPVHNRYTYLNAISKAQVSCQIFQVPEKFHNYVCHVYFSSTFLPPLFE